MKHILIVYLLFPFIVLCQSSFDQAEKLFEEGKLEQSQTIFQVLLKKNPSNLKANEYLGDIAGRNKSWDEAIMYYGKLKLLKPSEANFFYKYGGALGMKALTVNKFRALGMIDEIKGSFEKAIELDSGHVDSRWALIDFYIKLPGIVGGSETKAIRYSNELSKLSAVDGYLSRGHIEEHFKRYATAEQQYKKGILSGYSKTSYQMLANLYKNKMNQPERAKIVLEEFRKKSNK
jgi:tetratricopeptide (TPR) repeat protein